MFNIWNIMNTEELIDYLKKNLDIQVSTNEEFGPVQVVKVELVLNDETISEDTFDIPEPRYEQ